MADSEEMHRLGMAAQFRFLFDKEGATLRRYLRILFFGACAGFLFVMSGCAGYVDTGYSSYGGPAYIGVDPYIPAPDIYVFGGTRYPYHHFDHDFSRRGFESRRGIRPPMHNYSNAGRFHGPSRGTGRGGSRGDRHH